MRGLLAATIEAAEAGDLAAVAELAEAFSGPLTFGTAGLRGRIGPGPHRMNSVVVARAAAGLAAYVLQQGGGRVVIGHDARTDSDLFADTTASILAGAGLDVLLLPRQVPTPVLAFAVRYLGCSAGVMVTASHNPPQDNGYKVYLDDGVQLVAPADSQISTFIAAATALGPVAELPRGESWTVLGDDVIEASVAAAAELVPADRPRHISVVYTPMHGVGGSTFHRVLERAGFAAPIVVTEQAEPDPTFPTVAFPNPEEPGALDLALATARAHQADLVIANDPDADRCAVAIPVGGRGSDEWRILSGDEVGWLLGWWIASGSAGLPTDGTLAESIVSGSMLGDIAADTGAAFTETLTGFKWIARVPGLIYGYEEALGYCVDPARVRDKDGITAALLVIAMAAELRAAGSDLQGQLDELARRFGVFATRQMSRRVDDLARIGQIMEALRANPPATIAGLAVTGFSDLAEGVDGLPPTEGLRFWLDSGARVIIRPSGTEPKIKCYLQSVVRNVADLDHARLVASHQLDEIGQQVQDWLR